MDVFTALSDPERRRLLELLRPGERTAGDLVAAVGAPQPAVSKQLRVLRDTGLVVVRKDARLRWYSLRPDRLADVDAWLEPFRTFWTDRLDALDRHLDEEH